MKRILIFSGTEDGRELAQALADVGCEVTVSVATPYGAELLEDARGIRVHCGRLDAAGMEAFLRGTVEDVGNERKSGGAGSGGDTESASLRNAAEKEGRGGGGDTEDVSLRDAAEKEERGGGYTDVIDATHPYATEATENIRAACAAAGIPYVRMLRDSALKRLMGPDLYLADDAAEAAQYLADREGVVFISTGSKELPAILGRIGNPERLRVRILPDPEAIRSCLEAGLKRKQLICMQGPFSEELNAAMFAQTKSRYLITKESGTVGGFAEKIRAARRCGMEIVVIRRPIEDGISPAEILRRFTKEGELAGGRGAQGKWTEPCGTSAREETLARCGDAAREETLAHCGDAARDGVAAKTHFGEKRIALVGIGMGGAEQMTGEALLACRKAKLLIGADRMIDAVAPILHPGQRTERLYLADRIRACIDVAGETRIAVLFSGDCGFYSGAKRLLEALADYDVTVIPGVSSVAALAARTHLPWDTMKLVSLHGREYNLPEAVRHEPFVFALAGGRDGVAKACDTLCRHGLANVRVIVGSNLSYPTERIETGTAAELTGYDAPGVSSMIICNERAVPRRTTHGVPDTAFLRGRVPMTKEEVRCVSLAKLGLFADAVVYDIGAGTGSVSVECALAVPAGRVYAIERDPEAQKLLAANRERFHLSNLEIVAGWAPEVLSDLPTPTHAFIGGSGGRLAEIAEALLRKNPQIRIVANAISLETLAGLTALGKRHGIGEPEVVCLNVSRAKRAGGHHLMLANHPVYIVSFGKRGWDMV